jgi:adenylate kinase family enzyme
VSRKIAVVGASGSGKTTLARLLANRLSLPYVELDALCHGPNWEEASDAEMQPRVRAAMASEGWVIDGNYERKLGDLVLEGADTVVWLDQPLALNLWRLSLRTTGRILRRTELWNGNREDWRTAFVGRDSLFAWAVRSHRRFRRELPTRFTRAPLSQLELVRLRSPRAVAHWIEQQR